MRKFSFLIVLFLFLVEFGCSGGSEPSTEVSMDSFCSELSGGIVKALKGCDATRYLLGFDYYNNYDEKIKSNMIKQCSALLDAVKDSIDKGRVVYDSKKAKELIDLLNGINGCEKGFLDKLDGLMFEVFKGSVDENGECYNKFECKYGLYCKVEGDQCGGVCVKRKDINEECKNDNECIYGAKCHKNRCYPVLGEPNGSCAGSCVDGYYCDEMESLCKPLKKQGEECTLKDECGEGLYCAASDNSETNSGVCEPVKQDGEQCKYGVDGDSPCGDFSVCDKGVCKPLPKANDPCLEDGFLPCGFTTLYCDESTNTCKPLPTEGEACGQNGIPDNCVFGYCDKNEHVCKPAKDIGEKCEEDDECLSDYCKDGTCQIDPADLCGVDTSETIEMTSQ